MLSGSGVRPHERSPEPAWLLNSEVREIILRWTWLRIGTSSWTDERSFVVSVILALGLGLILAVWANNDTIHTFLRNRGWTNRTSYPSEWFGVFRRDGKRYLTLHLSGKRRLFGWPEEWPDHPDRGHFVISQPEWLLDTGERAPLYNVSKLLIPANKGLCSIKAGFSYR